MTSPIRYARLGYAALKVTDLARSVDFYTRLVGLAPGRQDQASAWLRCSEKPCDLILEQGATAGLRRIGFELESRQALSDAHDRLRALGYAPHWAPAGELEPRRVEAGFRFRHPLTGLELEFYFGQAPAAPAYRPSVAQITRLGHVVLSVTAADFAAVHRFFVEDLGFAVSDEVPGAVAFLRCFPNPLHHTLALVKADRTGLNHVNFMVTDLDDIGRAMNRMKAADTPIVFGPGRHLPSTSVFLYFLDPDGMTVEYSFGMEEFHEGAARPPRELEARPEVLDTWGSLPEARFARVGEILVD
jgi:2,3-dihydroxy-p-cumate/2,3-dihydroxybenzoate 3,4-dioxygenase